MRYRGLLVVAIAAGLVLMHHLRPVTHGELAPAVGCHRSATSMTGLTPAAHALSTPLSVTPRASVATASGISCCDAMNMVGHPCLAVLTIVTALSGVLIGLLAGRLPARAANALDALSVGSGGVLGGWVLGGWAPPTSCRLAYLCVLRC